MGMLFDLLIPQLRERFPDRPFRLETTPHLQLVFPAVHSAVGDLVIMEEGDELILIAGNFTHGHFANYDYDKSVEYKAEVITRDILRFLTDLFADRVILWGSHRGGGGWYPRDLEGDQLSPRRAGPLCVWSGPLTNNESKP